MNSANLVQADESTVRPFVGIERLAVHPLSSGSVSLHLQLLSKWLGADRSLFIEKFLDLTKDKCVAFERCRVVCLEVPNVGPDRLRLLRRRKPTEPIVKFGDGDIESAVDSRSAWSPSGHDIPLVTS